MAVNRLTFNANLAMLGDNDKFLRTLRAWKPKTIVLMNAISTESQSMFQRVKRDMRTWGGIVIYRRYENGDHHLWTKYKEPGDYLDLLMRESGQDKSIWYHVHNEPLPGDNESRDNFMNWTAAIIELAIQRDMRLCVGNLAIAAMSQGRHDVNQWDTLLRALGKYADRQIDGVGQILMGTHEYTHALLPWGAADRDPRDLVDPLKIALDKWPTAEEVRSNPDKNWHIYRTEWFIDRIRALTGKTPHVVITEAFHDRMPNIEVQFKEATAAIDAIAGRKIKGVPTLIQYWNNMFPVLKAVRILCEQYLWAENLYPAYYLGFALFSWTHHNELPDKWKDNCDLSEQDQFLTEWPVFFLERMKPIPPTPEPPAPPPQPVTTAPPASDPRWYPTLAYTHPGNYANVRADEKEASADLGDFKADKPGKLVKVIYMPRIDNAYFPFWDGDLRGWVNEMYVAIGMPPMPTAADVRWLKYKAYTPAAMTTPVREWCNPQGRGLFNLGGGGVEVEHIPNSLLTERERAYLNGWHVVKIGGVVGYVEPRVSFETVVTTPPAETVTIDVKRRDELLKKEKQLDELGPKYLAVMTTAARLARQMLKVRGEFNTALNQFQSPLVEMSDIAESLSELADIGD